MLIYPEPPHFSVSLSLIPLYLPCCLLQCFTVTENYSQDSIKNNLIVGSVTAKCQNLDAYKVNSAQLSLGYPPATGPLPVQPQRERSCNLRQ